MNVLVTGSNGFIGGHVCKYLKENGIFVIGLDLHEEMKKECDKYISFDLAKSDYCDLREQLSDTIPDAVVHLASDMRKEPYTVEVVTNNLRGTQSLLEFCESNNVGCFVQLSSQPVIGKPAVLPITELHPICPPTVYHTTKYTQELLADYAYRKHGLRTVSFRICSPVGEGVNPKTIFPTFIRKALANEDIVLIGKGTRRQTYIHVLDISQAILKAIKNEQALGLYNLASYNNISNIELAEKCIEILNSKSKIVFADKPDEMDSWNWNISIDKIKKDIGYEPTVSIEDAIKDYSNALLGGRI